MVQSRSSPRNSPLPGYPPCSTILYFSVCVRSIPYQNSIQGAPADQLNRFPLGGRYGCAVSYFPFSTTRSVSVKGSCRVGAGSWEASALGEAASSEAFWNRAMLARFELLSLPGGGVEADCALRLCSFSICFICALRLTSASNRACRSALIDCFAK